MAESNGPKWPGPITFNDDDPKKGYFTLFLTLEEMKTNKVFIGRNTPKNAVFNDFSEMFTKGAILVKGKVTPTDGPIDGPAVEYEYNKSLPEDIKPEMCKFKFKGNQIILSVCKAESVSWSQHAKYLLKRDG